MNNALYMLNTPKRPRMMVENAEFPELDEHGNVIGRIDKHELLVRETESLLTCINNSDSFITNAEDMTIDELIHDFIKLTLTADLPYTFKFVAFTRLLFIMHQEHFKEYEYLLNELMSDAYPDEDNDTTSIN